MSTADTERDFIGRREEFLTRIIERLGLHPLDYRPEMGTIAASEKTATPQRAAGVLLPLLFRESSLGGDQGEFVFQLIKRSSRVSQPGDLSCPGGMVHPIADRLLRPFLLYGPVPVFRGPARDLALRRGPEDLRFITLFLANALRESWEEIGLSPCRVRFLGPLSSYRLVSFRRTIFPLVGFVDRPGALHPNREVEKVVEIPLSSFFRDDMIGCHSLLPSGADETASGSLRYPCLIHREPDGGEEILWGATFHIIVQFLKIIMDYRLPDWQKGRVIPRVLRPDYLTGRAPS